MAEYHNKIRRMMQGEPLTLLTAWCFDKPDQQALRELGFDDIRVSPACDAPLGGLFFGERVMGMQLRHLEGKTDTFHSFPIPCVSDAADLKRLNTDPKKSDLWNTFMERVARREDDLPVSMIGYSPFDAAVHLAGVEAICCSLLDEDGFAQAVMDAYEQIMFRMLDEFIGRVGMPQTGGSGFPGISISDLGTINLSGPILAEKIYPYYARMASYCGGAAVSTSSPDEASFRALCEMQNVHAVTADARISCETIDRYLGKKTLILYDYERLPGLEGPQLVDGVYMNPIVASHGDDSAELWQHLGKKHSLRIHVERRRFADVCERTEAIRAGKKD